MALWKEKRDRGKLARSSHLQQKVRVTPNSKEDYRWRDYLIEAVEILS